MHVCIYIYIYNNTYIPLYMHCITLHVHARQHTSTFLERSKLPSEVPKDGLAAVKDMGLGWFQLDVFTT
jgi:hypothetical protein